MAHALETRITGSTNQQQAWRSDHEVIDFGVASDAVGFDTVEIVIQNGRSVRVFINGPDLTV